MLGYRTGLFNIIWLLKLHDWDFGCLDFADSSNMALPISIDRLLRRSSIFALGNTNATGLVGGTAQVLTAICSTRKLFIDCWR